MEVKALGPAPALRVREVDPDAVLVAAAREEPRRFLALYDRYFDRVLGYVRLRVRDGARAARSLSGRRQLRGLVVPDRAQRGSRRAPQAGAERAARRADRLG